MIGGFHRPHPKEAGMNDYVTKPYKKDEILEKISAFLNKYSNVYEFKSDLSVTRF